MQIIPDNLDSQAVIQLLKDHLDDMYATTPAESVHALDVESLKHSSITFWRAEKNGEILGCIAIKELNSKHAEIKSMRTAANARNQGVGSALLNHVIKVAKFRNYQQISLETGAMDFFKPARKLYENNGFIYCQAFANYKSDVNSCFMTLKLC
jgi:putative acetyltransferase